MAKESVIMFRLLDKKVDEGSHFINQDGTVDQSKKIDFTHRHGVLNPYYYIVKEGQDKGKRIYQRYIAGCPFFDIDRQNKEGYVMDSVNGVVEFKAGGDIICDPVENKHLIDWLKNHPMNTSSPYHDPDKHDKQFFTYDPSEAIKKEIDQTDIADKAMGVVFSLKNNPERLKAVANLFAETSGLTDDGEIYLRLRKLSQEDPVTFSESIASQEKAVLGDIMLAKTYALINRNAKGYYHEGTEGVIFEPSAKKDAAADVELAQFLMSREGSEHYKQILVKIRQKEIELNSPSETTTTT